jgi:hypothetical protein
MCLQVCASTLTDGIEILASLLHPGLFDVPEHRAHKFINVCKQKVYARS